MAPRVIIAEDPDLLALAMLYTRLSNARLVYMPFEYYPGASYATPEVAQHWRAIEQRCSPMVSDWILPGDKIADLYAGALAPPERVHVVYNGSPRRHNASPPKLRRQLGVGPDVKLILYQGGVQEKRGLWDVLEAMPLLPRNIHFVVLGGGEVDRLRQDAAARGLSARVHVLGLIPQSDLLDYTKDADVALIPIHNTCVSYNLCNPGKLFEYLAAGVPVVVSRLAQLEWFVKKNGLGEVFDLQSPPDMARAIRRLLEDDEYRAACRRRCQLVHETSVCWELQAERLCHAVLGSDSLGTSSVKRATLTVEHASGSSQLGSPH